MHTAPHTRGAVTHVIIMDGTMSSLRPGEETNAGLTYRLLCEAPAGTRLSLRYEQGVQWTQWREIMNVVQGRGINRQIKRAYGFLASRYRPGDKIFLIGYSRGAYAVRSLAGMIDRVGMVKPKYATVRHIRDAYRHYQHDPNSEIARAFTTRFCHGDVPIEMVGVWDTVKALGSAVPFSGIWHVSSQDFHSHRLGTSIRNGFHALAHDEARMVYAPVMWESRPDWPGRLEQMWFRGTHGDIGGHLGGFQAARPLSNIPLVWMLERAETCGLPLPEGWRDRFEQDPRAPSVGSLRGWGKLFWIRRKRIVGADPSEALHPTLAETLGP